MSAPTWIAARLRASPRFVLIARGDAPEEVRRRLAADGDWLLRPTAPEDRWRVIGPAAAKLLRDHAAARPLEDARPESEEVRAVARLVLDGILEVEDERGFVGGPAAYPRLFPDPPQGEPTGPTSRLSLEALRYVEALRIDHPGHTARRLYGYNTLPVTPELAGRFAAPGSVEEYLRVTSSGGAWSRSDGGPRIRHRADEAWLSWHLEGEVDEDAPTYKLYVSPLPDDLPKAFRIVAEGFEASGAFAFKAGRTLDGMLRPDKLILYFTDSDPLRRFATELAGTRGLRPHGVPFTASLDDRGLLSWGMDPPRTGGSWVGDSWRAWVTGLLASAVIAVRRAGPPRVSAAEFAIARVRLEGVDTDTWAPSIPS